MAVRGVLRRMQNPSASWYRFTAFLLKLENAGNVPPWALIWRIKKLIFFKKVAEKPPKSALHGTRAFSSFKFCANT